MKLHSNRMYIGKNDKGRKIRQWLILYFSLFVFLSTVGILIFLIQRDRNNQEDTMSVVAKQEEAVPDIQAASANTVSTLDREETRTALVEKANDLADGHDIDGAIQLIKNTVGYEKYNDCKDMISRLEKEKGRLVPADVLQIPHIFFHPLIYDTDLAFKNNKDSSSVESLNTAMTTVDEFNEILNQLYKNKYVLVSIHDAAEVITMKNGKKKLKNGKIMLPPGMKPIIISQDDVSYYEKWNGKGIANRIVMDKNGKPTCEVDLADGSTITGDYDLAPLLERFIEKHPDFSYRGARAILAVTGREGVWGYRTSKYLPGEDSDSKINSEKEFDINSAECKKAIAVSQGLRNAGYDLASHSFVHEGLGRCSMHLIKYDTKRWEKEVESIIGESDIMIYPKGEDIEHGEDGYKYVNSNQRFQKLSEAGFLFFCNVDGNNAAWTMMENKYYRQARVALDGNVMYYQKNKLKQFYGLKVSKIWDKNRPKKPPLTTY